METHDRNAIYGGLVAIVIILLGYIAWNMWHGGHSPLAPTSMPFSLATSSQGTLGTTTTPSYTLKAVPISTAASIKAPDYQSTISCAVDIAADQCAAIQSQASAIEAALAKNPHDPDAWINLGTAREEAGDYSGAEVAWTYMTKLYPGSPTAFDNLGDLYATYLHENQSAAADYLASIKIYPGDPSPYEALAMMYMQSSAGAGGAQNILKQGIVANPKAVNLQVDLARDYKQAGDSADAQAEYSAAIKNAQAQGQSALAAQIQQEATQ